MAKMYAIEVANGQGLRCRKRTSRYTMQAEGRGHDWQRKSRAKNLPIVPESPNKNPGAAASVRFLFFPICRGAIIDG